MKEWLVVDNKTRAVTAVVAVFGDLEPIDGLTYYEKPPTMEYNTYDFTYTVDTDGNIYQHRKEIAQ